MKKNKKNQKLSKAQKEHRKYKKDLKRMDRRQDSEFERKAALAGLTKEEYIKRFKPSINKYGSSRNFGRGLP